MSEFGEYSDGQEHASLEAVHEDAGHEQDFQSQYGILEQDHHSVIHDELENMKHIEYTDAAGNHYEITEYTHIEHTEIQDSHTLLSYGEEGGDSNFGQADGLEAADSSSAIHGASVASSGLNGLTERFEDFLSSAFSDNEINDASA
jgi:hypothetical protein